MTTTPEFTTDNWSDLDTAEKFLDIVDRAKVIKYLAIASAKAEGADRDNLLLGIRVLADDIWFASETAHNEYLDRIREDICNPDWRRKAA